MSAFIHAHTLVGSVRRQRSPSILGRHRCSGDPDLSRIVLSPDELHQPGGLSDATRARAHRALTECGYVYLDNFFSAEQVGRFRDAYYELRDSSEGDEMRYPCQGAGRVEHMLPFRPPFNTSNIYGDERLLQLLSDYLQASYPLGKTRAPWPDDGSGWKRQWKPSGGRTLWSDDGSLSLSSLSGRINSSSSS